MKTMKCIGKQERCPETNGTISHGCLMTDDSFIDCVSGVCYIQWSNVTGTVGIQKQGCWRNNTYCDDRSECWSYQTRKKHEFFCCCSEPFCNWMVYNAPLVAPIRNKNLSSNVSTGLSYISDTDYKFQTVNKKVNYSQTPALIPLVLPIICTVLCLTIILFLWQRYFNKKQNSIINNIRKVENNHCRKFLVNCFKDSSKLQDHNSKTSLGDHKQYIHSVAVKEVKEKVALVEVIGEGRYGKVWLGLLRQQKVAIKVFDASKKNSFVNESNIYSLLDVNNNVNILQLIGTNEASIGDSPAGSMYMILEYQEKGSLYNYLQTHVLAWMEVLKIAEGIAAGLAFMHEAIPEDNNQDEKPPVAHRDMKTSNVLLKCDLTPCISDFGLSHIFDSYHLSHVTESFCQVGSLMYMAPEMLDRATNLDTQAFLNVDMYAFGLILWELVSRCAFEKLEVEPYQAPFHKELGVNPSINTFIEKVVENKLRPEIKQQWLVQDDMKEFCQTVCECWDQDPDARISAGCVEQRMLQLQQNEQTNCSRDLNVESSENSSCLDSQNENSNGYDSQLYHKNNVFVANTEEQNHVLTAHNQRISGTILQSCGSNLVPPGYSLQPPETSIQPPAYNLQHPAYYLKKPAYNLRPPGCSIRPPEYNMQSQETIIHPETNI